MFPVALEYISNSEIITVESGEEKNSNPEPAPNPDVFQECSVCSNYEMVNLCPIWQGEYNNFLHQNTCSIDNIISFISLYRVTIEEARRIIDISLNPDAQHFFSLIYRRKFDELRDYIARLAGISVTYDVIVPKYDFHGSEATIINLIRKLDISNDHYSVRLQCYNCCATFTTVTQIGSVQSVTFSLQESINAKMMPKKCIKCQSTESNLEILSGAFNTVPYVFIVELGYLPDSRCTLQTKDIDELVFISENTKTLAYRLAGFTLSLGILFYMIVNLKGVWFKYDDLLSPSLTKCLKGTTLGRLNSVLYVLDVKLSH